MRYALQVLQVVSGRASARLALREPSALAAALAAVQPLARIAQPDSTRIQVPAHRALRARTCEGHVEAVERRGALVITIMV